jgi:hypothetical protein
VMRALAQIAEPLSPEPRRRGTFQLSVVMPGVSLAASRRLGFLPKE